MVARCLYQYDVAPKYNTIMIIFLAEIDFYEI